MPAPSDLWVFVFLQDTQHTKDVDEQFSDGSSTSSYFVFTDVQFNTHLSDASDKAVLKKSAAFVFKYQAVTPENENKVRVFPPFLKIPEINLTDAYTILQTRGHTDSMTGMDTVKLCQTERMGTLYNQLIDQLEEKLSLIQKEINAAHTDQNQLVEKASSILPPSIKPDHGTGCSKRAVWIITVAAGAAGLVLGSPVKDAACSALFIFNLCTHTKDLEENVDHVMATQKQFQAVLERVQTKNNENFIILENEIKETQEVYRKNGNSWWSIKTPANRITWNQRRICFIVNM